MCAVKRLKSLQAEKDIDEIAGCLQLAMVLEVSAYPKPGNIHRAADFEETRYEHFLASAIGVGPHFREAARRGVLLGSERIHGSDVGIGAVTRDAVLDVAKWQHGGNTSLGSIILLMPIAVAAGSVSRKGMFTIDDLRSSIKTVTDNTTAKDTLALYESIDTAKPGGLGEVPMLDVKKIETKEIIARQNVTILDVFKIASTYDSIASEWVNNYHITFDLAYPYFNEQMTLIKDINVATVHTFLKVLSEVPDTLIARKVGEEKAREVSLEANRVLREGGLVSSEGKKRLAEFDSSLRTADHKFNPGTTADLIVAVLAVGLLMGMRP